MRDRPDSYAELDREIEDRRIAFRAHILGEREVFEAAWQLFKAHLLRDVELTEEQQRENAYRRRCRKLLLSEHMRDIEAARWEGSDYVDESGKPR
jgi:hypothetical protein